MSLRKIGIIIGREFGTRIGKKSFIVMTLLAPLIISGILVFSIWLSQQENRDAHILVVDQTEVMYPRLQDEIGLRFSHQKGISLAQAKALLRVEEPIYTSVLFVPKNIMSGKVSKLFATSTPSVNIQRRVERQLEEILERQFALYNNIPDETYKAMNVSFILSPFVIKKSGEETRVDGEKAQVGFFFAIAIFMMIMMYSTMVMRGVMEEKINRIVEVVISSVKPFELMMGKVIGVALVGVLQVVLWVSLTTILFIIAKLVFFPELIDPSVLEHMQTTGEVAKQIKSSKGLSLDIQNGNSILSRVNFSVMLPLFFFYFLAGYFLYSGLFAAVGAIIDSESETQQFVIPLTMPLIIAYTISFSIMQNPEGPVAFWGSMIPFTSPIVMMIRSSIGVGGGNGIPLWEVLLSMILLILTFIFTIYIAAKIYKVGILTHGKKPSLSDVWLWIKS